MVLVLHRLVRHLSSELYKTKQNSFHAKVIVSFAQGVVGAQTKPMGEGRGEDLRRQVSKVEREMHHLLPVRIIFVLVQILSKGEELTKVSDSALGKGQGKRRSEGGMRGGKRTRMLKVGYRAGVCRYCTHPKPSRSVVRLLLLEATTGREASRRR